MDWAKIKTEYITTDTSYRKLARKYGADQATVARRAKKEGWVEARQQHVSETQAKIVETIADGRVDRAARLLTVSDRLLDRVEVLVAGAEPAELDVRDLKQISGILKDLKDVQMIRPDADVREQEARIAQLERQALKDEKGDGKITVVLEGALKDYAQ